MSTQLTEHFTLEELTRSTTAVRKGLDNTPPPEIVANMTRVAQALEKVRAHFGQPVRVTSCYRSPSVNVAVGGSLTSAHRFGLAADFEVAGIAHADVCRAIPELVPEFDQVIYEFGPTGWVHLGLSSNGGRGEQLTAVKQGRRTVYKPGIQELWQTAQG